SRRPCRAGNLQGVFHLGRRSISGLWLLDWLGGATRSGERGGSDRPGRSTSGSPSGRQVGGGAGSVPSAPRPASQPGDDPAPPARSIPSDVAGHGRRQRIPTTYPMVVLFVYEWYLQPGGGRSGPAGGAGRGARAGRPATGDSARVAGHTIGARPPHPPTAARSGPGRTRRR